MTEQPKPFLTPRRNPATHAKHRKEVFWMIWFPVIIGALLVVAAVVGLVIMTVNEARFEEELATWEPTAMVGDFTPEEKGLMLYERGTTSRLSSISQMWLMLPVFLFTLLLLIILIGLAYLFTKLINVLPEAMLKAQEFTALVAYKVRSMMDSAVEPFVKYNSIKASIRQAKLALAQQVSDLFGRIEE
jgi:hypothetical protein